jgi:hypothetical protein
MLDLELGQMFLQLPIISFPKYEVFDRSKPIYCNVNTSDLQETNQKQSIELTEQHCKIEKHNETPIFVNLGLFRNVSCEIQTPNMNLTKNYNYHHKNENFFVFLHKNDKNILLFNTCRFFKESDNFWILLKNDLKIIPNPSSIFENLIYPNYSAYNLGFTSNNYEIQIFDENNNLCLTLFKEPKISFIPIEDGYIFDEFYHEEPLFSTDFKIKLECSDILKKYPKCVHIQNSITEKLGRQEKVCETFKWIEDDEFKITPELLNNKIGSYQVDIEFYTDKSYTKKLFEKSIRGFFRYCPIRINNNWGFQSIL